jgi:hypothetical protein
VPGLIALLLFAPPVGLDLPSLVEPVVPYLTSVDPLDPPTPPLTDPVLPAAPVVPRPRAVAARAPTVDLAEARYEHDLRERTSIAKIHRVAGISTWISMGVTLLFGGFQFHNLYGEWADVNHNPCATGRGLIFGADQCYDGPWLHAITEGVTTALYFTTFTLSLLMPDPDHADGGNGAFANNLRWHEALRWVHLGGMIAQIILGLVMANARLDRANDYDLLEALATVHMGIGIVTYGALTAAAALMTF